MKLKLLLTRDEIVAKFAADLGVDTNQIELEIDGLDDIKVTLPQTMFQDEDEPEPKPAEPEPKLRFLARFMDEHDLSKEDVAALTNLSKSTITRAIGGYWLNTTTRGKIIRGLGLNDDEIRAFHKDMTKHQR